MILALLIFVSLIASCGDKSNQAAGTTAEPSGADDAVTENPFGDDLPDDLDFGGEKVRVLIFENGNNPSDGWCCYIDMDESTGEILNDAAVQRNMEVETRLNIEIECIEGSGVVDLVAKSVTAGMAPTTSRLLSRDIDKLIISTCCMTSHRRLSSL